MRQEDKSQSSVHEQTKRGRWSAGSVMTCWILVAESMSVCRAFWMANGAIRGVVIFGALGWKDGCGRSFETQYSVITATAEGMAFAYVLRGKILLYGSGFE